MVVIKATGGCACSWSCAAPDCRPSLLLIRIHNILIKCVRWCCSGSRYCTTAPHTAPHTAPPRTPRPGAAHGAHSLAFWGIRKIEKDGKSTNENFFIAIWTGSEHIHSTIIICGCHTTSAKSSPESDFCSSQSTAGSGQLEPPRDVLEVGRGGDFNFLGRHV